jgi:predicted glutamine amidotransferase
MCRFALYLGPPIQLAALVTRPTNSIIHQSFQNAEREEPLNGDGFGVAWYVPEVTAEPAVFRSVSPAWSNQNLQSLARVTRSPCVLAHVRAATPGLPVTETNCHPFVAGRLAFMHNGDVPGFLRMKRTLQGLLSDEAYHAIHGSTDSEHLFALFLDRLRETGGDGAARLTAALDATLSQIVALSRQFGIDEPAYLNIAVTDGEHAVVVRGTTGPPELAESLYVHTGRQYVCEGDVCRMIDPDDGEAAVLVCSERLSEDPGWDRVPPNHLVILHDGERVEVRPWSLG